MDCIILAGGMGTRLRSVVPHLPKGLAPIQGVPFLHVMVKELSRLPLVSKIIFALGYLAQTIIDSFQGSSVPLYFSCEETPLGTGGAIRKALALAETEQVLVLNGDTYLNWSLDDMLSLHQRKGADISIACKELEDAGRFGTIQLSSEGRIEAFHEKQSGSGLVSCGVYLFRKTLFHNVPFKDPFSLEREGFPHFLKSHKLVGFVTEGTFIDIGTPESYIESQTLLRSVL